MCVFSAFLFDMINMFTTIYNYYETTGRYNVYFNVVYIFKIISDNFIIFLLILIIKTTCIIPI